MTSADRTRSDWLITHRTPGEVEQGGDQVVVVAAVVVVGAAAVGWTTAGGGGGPSLWLLAGGRGLVPVGLTRVRGGQAAPGPHWASGALCLGPPGLVL